MVCVQWTDVAALDCVTQANAAVFMRWVRLLLKDASGLARIKTSCLFDLEELTAATATATFNLRP